MLSSERRLSLQPYPGTNTPIRMSLRQDLCVLGGVKVDECCSLQKLEEYMWSTLRSGEGS